MPVGPTEILTALQQIMQAINNQTKVYTVKGGTQTALHQIIAAMGGAPQADGTIRFERPPPERPPDGYLEMRGPDGAPVKVPYYNNV